MSFLKKLGESAKSTASTIGAKSANLVETGKLKLAKSQLESKIDNKKQEIGDIVYTAYKEGAEPDREQLQAKFDEIAGFEGQIMEIEVQLAQPKEAAAPEAQPREAASPAPQPASKFCSNCGNPVGEGQKFCQNCGKPV
jgi:hypothetical protein